MAAWQLQEAKNKLSELIDCALADGPQIITRHGVETVVVMPYTGYKKLTAPQQRLGDFFLASPLRDSGLVIERIQSAALRELDLSRCPICLTPAWSPNSSSRNLNAK